MTTAEADALRDKFEYYVETVNRHVLQGIEPYPVLQMTKDLNARGAQGWELIVVNSAMINQNTMMTQFVWMRKVLETRQ